MSPRRPGPPRDPLAAAAIAAAAAVALSAAAFGFVWLPSLQADARLAGMWGRICGAAGTLQASPTEPVVQAAYATTLAVAEPQVSAAAAAVSVGRGATLAMQCTTCHGARGLSEASSPNLAGQYAAVVLKQLQDYRSGARANAIMGPRVAGLSGQDMRDLAAYYAYLPRLPATHPASAGPAPGIVLGGAPMRGIAPCAACHGGEGVKAGSAWLEGEPAAYLRSQIEAFATGTRHNDVSAQMRNVARGLSQPEIDAAARYYAGPP